MSIFPTTSTVKNSTSFAAPTCCIEVYPYEGGKYSIVGGQIISASTTKNIRNVSPGQFEITLAPGGPQGPESTVTWSEIITPGSFVLIGIQRGTDAAMVMAGVATSISETQSWVTSDGMSQAGRVQVIAGNDFTWFFNSFNWASLSFLGLTSGAALASIFGSGGAFPEILSKGLLGGNNPAQVAYLWYKNVMAGENGILGKAFIPYQNSSRIKFIEALSTAWENYPDVQIPFGDYFMAAEGTWSAKFAMMLPFPWYEFFITTAPLGSYDGTGQAASTSSQGTQTDSRKTDGSSGTVKFSGTFSQGYKFTMTSMPAIPASGPSIVARVNPTPAITMKATSGAEGATIGAIDMTRWNALPLRTITDTGFMTSNIQFSANGARNFYMLNPTWFRNLPGNDNANTSPWAYYFIAAADPASIHRYGYRPEMPSFRWLSDLQGTSAQQSDLGLNQTVAAMTARVVSWHEPSPMMGIGSVVIPLAPGIRVGDRFQYSPFKGQETWDFYVENVAHNFIFGGGTLSTTTLGLSRGLPSSVYADTKESGVLQAIHVGNAQRLDGKYVVGLPKDSGPGLTVFGQPDAIRDILGKIANTYVTPQQK